MRKKQIKYRVYVHLSLELKAESRGDATIKAWETLKKLPKKTHYKIIDVYEN